MERFSPKIEIINHFDDLIHKVDIDIEEKIEKYNENQFLGELQCLKDKNLRIEVDYKLRIEFCESSDDNKEQKVDQWSKSTKIVDYLNQIRMITIEELRKEQKESVEISSRFNCLNSELTKEEKRSELFAEKFYFQVKITRTDIKPWVFNLFTFVTDFYISQSYIDLLEKLINSTKTKDKFLIQDHIFDEKMVLICLLYKYFLDNINNNKFPNHVIHVFKHDVSKIEGIDVSLNISAINVNSSSIDLSKLKRLTIKTATALDYIIIDSLYSLEYLHLDFASVKKILIKNLDSLKVLYILSKAIIKLQSELIDHLPNIEIFSYKNYFISFLFTKLEKSIDLSTKLFLKDFNFDFMHNFCNQIEKLKIEQSRNIDHINWPLKKYLSSFSNLISLSISSCDIRTIDKNFLNEFPQMVQTLIIKDNHNLEIIDYDAFLNFKQLVSLDLSHNCIESLDRRHFSSLISLESLYLGRNRLKRLDDNIFSDLKKLEKLILKENKFNSLKANSFFGLENLRELNLSRNTFKKIENDVFSNLKHLVSLDLSHNYIESLDRRHFSSLINLERLDLGWNRLKRLDDNIFSDLKNLICLNLSHNQLKALDANTFVGLENLKELYFNNNEIEKIHHDVFSNLKQLVHLGICQNNIESLDRRHLSSLINLKRLDLCYIGLKRLDEYVFSNLKNPKSLDLSHNRLETLDSNTFSGLESLSQLNLSNNKLEIIDHEAFLNLKKLVCLDLSHNSIELLDRRLFSGLVNLKILNLSNNRLKRLDYNIFSNLMILESLSLSNNQLEIFDVNSFVGLDSLKRLNLNLNKLKHFDVRILDDLSRLESIYILGNEISSLNEKSSIIYHF